MPRAKVPTDTTEGQLLTNQTQALVETLRAVASQVEADPALAARLMAGSTTKAESGETAQAVPRPAREVVAPPLDPFAGATAGGRAGITGGACLAGSRVAEGHRAGVPARSRANLGALDGA